MSRKYTGNIVDLLNQIVTDFENNYSSAYQFGEAHNLTEEQAIELLRLGLQVRINEKIEAENA